MSGPRRRGDMSESEKIKEIARLIHDKENAEKKVATINKMIAEIVNAYPSVQRKSKRSSPKDFARGCGI